MARKHYTNPTQAWDASLNVDDCRVSLSADALSELQNAVCRATVDDLGRLSGVDIARDVPAVRAFADDCRRSLLDQPPGFAIISQLTEDGVAVEKSREVVRILSECLGRIIPQDGHVLEMKAVKDRGLNLAQQKGARYSDGRQGGGLHTDGVERPMDLTPDYFALGCQNVATEGGKSQLISAYTVHNRLLENHADLLEVLYQPFHVDLRGDVGQDGKKTATKPIFFPRGDDIGATYLRHYVNAGHEYDDVPDLTTEQCAALDALDEILSDSSIIAEFDLSAGEIILVNNFVLFHGRTGFRDSERSASNPENRKRLLHRTWIKYRQ